jgi:hypothetical protein
VCLLSNAKPLTLKHQSNGVLKGPAGARWPAGGADGDAFLEGGQGIFQAAQGSQAVRLVVQRHGEVGEESVGASGGQLAVGGDGLLDDGQGVFPAAPFGTSRRESACRCSHLSTAS